MTKVDLRFQIIKLTFNDILKSKIVNPYSKILYLKQSSLRRGRNKAFSVCKKTFGV